MSKSPIISGYEQVNVLRKLKFTLSKQTLSNIYLTFIRPTLEYACEVWDGCLEREVAKLEKVQLESARIVTGLRERPFNLKGGGGGGGGLWSFLKIF